MSPAAGRVVLLTRDASGALLCREKEGDTWSTPRSLGVPIGRSPDGDVEVAVDWQLAGCGDGEGAVDLVARSPDGDFLHLRSTLDARVLFTCLGAPAAMPASRAVPIGLATPPAVCRSSPDRLEAFAVAPDGDLLQAVCRAGHQGYPGSLAGSFLTQRLADTTGRSGDEHA